MDKITELEYKQGYLILGLKNTLEWMKIYFKANLLHWKPDYTDTELEEKWNSVYKNDPSFLAIREAFNILDKQL